MTRDHARSAATPIGGGLAGSGAKLARGERPLEEGKRSRDTIPNDARSRRCRARDRRGEPLGLRAHDGLVERDEDARPARRHRAAAHRAPASASRTSSNSCAASPSPTTSSVLEHQAHQPVRPVERDRRHLEQAQQMPRRRRIDDDAREPALEERVAEDARARTARRSPAARARAGRARSRDRAATSTPRPTSRVEQRVDARLVLVAQRARTRRSRPSAERRGPARRRARLRRRRAPTRHRLRRARRRSTARDRSRRAASVRLIRPRRRARARRRRCSCRRRLCRQRSSAGARVARARRLPRRRAVRRGRFVGCVCATRRNGRLAIRGAHRGSPDRRRARWLRPRQRCNAAICASSSSARAEIADRIALTIDRGDAHVQRAQAVEVAPRLGGDERLGARDDDARRRARRRRALAAARRRARASRREIVGAVAAVAMRERAHHEAMLVLHRVEHRRAARGTFRAARAAGACGRSARCRRRCARTAIAIVGEDVGEREQREDLVAAGQRGVDQTVDVARDRDTCRDR